MSDRTRGPRSSSVLVTAAVALVFATGCGSGQQPAGEGRTDAPAAPDQPSGPAGGSAERPDVAAILLQVHPERADEDASAPTGLGVVDLRAGDGPVAQVGDTLVVQYHGVRWSDGGTFDASWDRGQPFTVVLGSGQVIAGWDQGLLGMQLGGRRVLTIPPALAYGDAGVPGASIGPGETLIFVVDLIGLVSTATS
jgi:peptidylprolyl isomerase